MSNELLVQELVSVSAITSGSVKNAFLSVDRVLFTPSKLVSEAYENYPLPIGFGQTISQPLTVALMLEDLAVQEGMRVLDVGCGSGYTTALLSFLVSSEGFVVGVERIPELVEFARSNLQQASIDVAVVKASSSLGLSQEAPFDRILVSAAAKSVPEKLVSQLAIGGLMVVPVSSSVLTVRKTKTSFEVVKRREGFRFVTLIE
ncbi:MAG: protein-L-isoaspartate(D-aspartate) O-methyltransferase [Candidatus Woesearchaeota archaeon]